MEYRHLSGKENEVVQEAIRLHKWSLAYCLLSLAGNITGLVLLFKGREGLAIICLILSVICYVYGAKIHHESHEVLDEI